jgi:hypothetical protein
VAAGRHSLKQLYAVLCNAMLRCNAMWRHIIMLRGVVMSMQAVSSGRFTQCQAMLCLGCSTWSLRVMRGPSTGKVRIIMAAIR